MPQPPDAEPWEIFIREGPILATAIHTGHDVRPAVAAFMKLTGAGRLREEDPFTDEFASEKDTLVRVNTSRFEVDLNRAREMAVYGRPETAWGLDVWNDPLPASERAASLDKYDRFYEALLDVVRTRLALHPRLILLDLHSYNHLRGGSEQPPASPADNPVVNVGTGAADRGVWGDVIDRLVRDLSQQRFQGEPLDARENIKFTGGELSRHIAREFGSSVLVLSVEFKKVFMDEWTGVKSTSRIRQLRDALESAVAPLRIALM